ncbi:MAG: hypothetical protein SVV67_09365 [Bacillota bacterium]|nr:hypothetical protein [Bacillota bacterium]
MKKTLLILTLIVALVLSLSSSVFAFGGFGSYGSGGTCLRDSLSEEEQPRLERIMEQFQNKMYELREKMLAFRKSGDDKGIQAVEEERFKLMEEKRTAMGAAFPELSERFQNSEQRKGYCCGGYGDYFNR